MERSPKKTKDKDIDNIFDFIFNNAFGNPLVLDSAPTAASQMKANSCGIFGVNFYVRFSNGVLLRFSGTQIS